MPELVLELFSEEIPARMQARAADDFTRLVSEALAPLSPRDLRRFSGPRRIALVAAIDAGVAETRQSERGPRLGAPEQALAGFLRKHGASREDLREEGAFWVLDRVRPGQDAAALVAAVLPGVLRRFPWPKSMRWGGSSAFTWVRPLRRIVCLVDGRVVPFDLRHGEDDGHGLVAGDKSEGHRFLAPGAFAVRDATQWQSELRARLVIADRDERRDAIERGVAAAAAEHGLSVVPDAGLLDEVTGLVEWPVPLLGRIDAAFMDLPPEVMQVSMRVNQRYFALRDAEGAAAPWFAFVANVAADDGGAAIVAGNERVLRARFADARYFWDLDRQTKLVDRVAALDAVTFHAKLGSQGDRVRRLVRIAGEIAPLVGANVEQAKRAAWLAKADLTTGMVGEFPELQGVMGRYYALHDGEDRVVADAIRDHYAPRGAVDGIPYEPVAVAVALADKLDQLVSFFRIGEKPTGSGDPFALRRSALGMVRIVETNLSRFSLHDLLDAAGASKERRELLDFTWERVRVAWRARGRAHDLVDAVLAIRDDSLFDLNRRYSELADVFALVGQRGVALAGYRRASKILAIENANDGPHVGIVKQDLLEHGSEVELSQKAGELATFVETKLRERDYRNALIAISGFGAVLEPFFENVTVNSPQPDLRENRLRLLNAVVETMNRVADFSKIEG